MCARYFLCFCFQVSVSPAENTICQNLILNILYSLSILETMHVFLINVERDELGVRRRKASPFANPYSRL